MGQTLLVDEHIWTCSLKSLLTSVQIHLTAASVQITKARIAESKGEPVSKELHEGILFRKYLENYMRTIPGRSISRENALQELHQQKPYKFIIESLRADTYQKHKSFLDKQAHDLQQVILNELEHHDL